MKKVFEIDAIKAVSFDIQESVKDLFFILGNMYNDIEQIKITLKNKDIM